MRGVNFRCGPHSPPFALPPACSAGDVSVEALQERAEKLEHKLQKKNVQVYKICVNIQVWAE